jgi:uncharacterized RDD family membrane protein YckC
VEGGLMSEPFGLPTPENVVVHYQLAGVGSRFLAAAVDTLIQVTLIILLVLALSALGGIALAGGVARPLADLNPENASIWLIAVLLLINFLLLWGYHVAFELLWNGQTPGKRACGLRVLRDSGYPLGFFDSVIRNLVRFVDFLPAFYGIGVLTMMLDGRWRRLGDLAAGTIVVRVGGDLRAADLIAAVPAEWTAPDAEDELAVDGLTERDYALLREYLLRRERLASDARAALARALSENLARRLALTPPPDEDVESFLERLVVAYRARYAARGQGRP